MAPTDGPLRTLRAARAPSEVTMIDFERSGAWRLSARATIAIVLAVCGGCRRERATALGPGETPMPQPVECKPPACVGVMDAASLAERVTPSVVNITTTERAPGALRGFDPFEFFFGGPGRREHPPQRMGLGSGFIIDPGG